jgi:hypothetical protein
MKRIVDFIKRVVAVGKELVRRIRTFVLWVRYVHFEREVMFLVWAMWVFGLLVFITGYFALVSLAVVVFVTLRSLK